MDEMNLVRKLGKSTPLPTQRDLAPARHQLVAAALRESTGAPDHPPRPRRARRWGLGGVATTGVAAAAAAVLVLNPLGGGQVPTAHAEAAEVLRHAADTARAQPDVQPRPDQFVYIKSQSRESWFSVDGTHDGQFVDVINGRIETTPVPGCRDGRRQVIKGDSPLPGVTEECVPTPAYDPNMPTDADAMLNFLLERNSHSPGNVNVLGKDVLALAETTYLRPRSKAALFEAIAKVPGIQVVPDSTDGAGRHGVGIRWSQQVGGSAVALAPMSTPGASRSPEQTGPSIPNSTEPSIEVPVVHLTGELVFDPNTYEFLGFANRSAVLTIGIVDQVGQRP